MLLRLAGEQTCSGLVDQRELVTRADVTHQTIRLLREHLLRADHGGSDLAGKRAE